MSGIDKLESTVAAWLEPLGDSAAPCGVDLEAHIDFLALTKAAAGRPENQFAAAEPPDWRKTAEVAESLFERTRDLRVAILWLRAQTRLAGYGGYCAGVALVEGLLDRQFDQLHPLPDLEDSEPQYPRLNALAVLREIDGVYGDLRSVRVVTDRSLGELTLRTVEIALGLAPARTGETDIGKDAVALQLAAAVARHPELRDDCALAVQRTKALITRLNDRFGVGEGPDLRPIHALVHGLNGLLPAPAAAVQDAPDDGTGDESTAPAASAGSAGAGAAVAGARGRGLSGSVTSREEALRAIEMVCEYLEAAEPTNPAPLFLRRASKLINYNFLQLMKVLAPDSLAVVAGVVGINPDSVEDPDAPPAQDE